MNGALAFDNIAINGIDAITGKYLWPKLTMKDLEQILDKTEDLPGVNEGLYHDLSARATRENDSKISLRRGDVRDLTQTGWAAIFANDANAEVVSALRPLLDHRRSHVVTNKATSHYYKEFSGELGHRRSEVKSDFLERHKVPPHSQADPSRLPYYLLIVGDPERIPFQFQYEMGVEYAVGRISFETIEEYRQYAETIVHYETHQRDKSTQGLFFAPTSKGDQATHLSLTHLVHPLVESMRSAFGDNIEKASGPDASKHYILNKLESNPPQFLFSASHGLGFSQHDERLFTRQGALLCSDWPGPTYSGEISPEWYLSADDLSDCINLKGMISFHFACYGAGTPAFDDFPLDSFSDVLPPRISPRAFVSALSKKLLSRGALAAIGHIERAWSYSFLSGGGTSQLAAFEDMCKNILEGFPVGAAMEPFSSRFASLAVELSEILNRHPRDKMREVLTRIDQNDARNYVIIGDPAARIS